MAVHIYHATATFAELGLAMSIASFTRLLPPINQVDILARETTENRIVITDGKFVASFYRLGCWLQEHWGIAAKKIPIFVFLADILVLFGMAYSKDNALVANSLFWVSFFAMVIMVGFVFFNRNTQQGAHGAPLIEPSE